MKFKVLVLSILLFGFAPAARALDPVAPVSERKFGMLYVKSPMPEEDEVNIDPLSGDGKKKKLHSEKEEKVPIGEYRIQVKMQDYSYEQDVKVGGTERTEVIVPGFGNLKVEAPEKSTVEVYKRGSGTVVAKFPVKKIKVLPVGYYDVKIIYLDDSVTMNNVWIVTNTTREVAATF